LNHLEGVGGGRGIYKIRAKRAALSLRAPGPPPPPPPPPPPDSPFSIRLAKTPCDVCDFGRKSVFSPAADSHFPLLHVDLAYKVFPQRSSFATRTTPARSARNFIVPQEIRRPWCGANPFFPRFERKKFCGLLKTKSLLDGPWAEGGFDAFAGVWKGRGRDEEKIPGPKERILPHLFPGKSIGAMGSEEPSRPELWEYFFNSKWIDNGEQAFGVFPAPDWTDLDIWLVYPSGNILIVFLSISPKERRSACWAEMASNCLIPGKRTLARRKDLILKCPGWFCSDCVPLCTEKRRNPFPKRILFARLWRDGFLFSRPFGARKNRNDRSREERSMEHQSGKATYGSSRRR